MAKEKESVESIIPWAENFYKEFKEAITQDTIQREEILTHTYTPLVVDYVKVIVDAVISPDQASSSSSVIVRNKMGLVMASSSFPALISPVIEAEAEAEATAILVGVRFATNLGFTKVQIVSDRLSMVRLFGFYKNSSGRS